MWHAGIDESQAGTNQDRWEKHQQPQTCRRYHSNSREWRGAEEPLEAERGEWKSWLKTELKIMASSPLLSLQIRWGEKWKQWQTLFSWASKITVDGDCSHEIKRGLLLGRKAVTNQDSVLKNRDITLPTVTSIVKAMIFPVVMYECGSWTIKKAECQRTDALKLCYRRHLRVPWTARRSNQSILREISPEYSLEGLMLKLKLWYSGHLMRRASSLEKTLMLGGIEGRRRREQQRMRWLDGITDSMDMNLSKL